MARVRKNLIFINSSSFKNEIIYIGKYILWLTHSLHARYIPRLLLNSNFIPTNDLLVPKMINLFIIQFICISLNDIIKAKVKANIQK